MGAVAGKTILLSWWTKVAILLRYTAILRRLHGFAKCSNICSVNTTIGTEQMVSAHDIRSVVPSFHFCFVRWIIK
jgi:hypothetical protein